MSNDIFRRYKRDVRVATLEKEKNTKIPNRGISKCECPPPRILALVLSFWCRWFRFGRVISDCRYGVCLNWTKCWESPTVCQARGIPRDRSGKWAPKRVLSGIPVRIVWHRGVWRRLGWEISWSWGFLFFWKPFDMWITDRIRCRVNCWGRDLRGANYHTHRLPSEI